MYRAESFGVGADEALLDERSVGLEHLNPIVDASAHVDEPILAFNRAVDRREVLGLHTRLIRPFDRLSTQRSVMRLVAVGPPMPLVGPSLSIEHDDTTVPVAVCDKQLVRF